MKNYYKVLGISENATINEIIDAYKTLAPQYHPDNNKGDRYAEERFIDLSVAYKTLTNSDIRKDYDRILKSVLESSGPKKKTDTKSSDIPRDIVASSSYTTMNKKNISIFSIVIILVVSASAAAYLLNSKFNTKNTETASVSSTTPVENTLSKTNEPVKEGTIASRTAAAEPIIGENKSTQPNVGYTPLIEEETEDTVPVAKKETIKKPATHIAAPKSNNIETTKVSVNEPTHFTVNSTKALVLKLQGTPGAITRYDNNVEEWSYGKSKIVFSNGKVTSYKNIDNNLIIK